MNVQIKMGITYYQPNFKISLEHGPQICYINQTRATSQCVDYSGYIDDLLYFLFVIL